MVNKINYDFDLSASVINKLYEISADIENTTSNRAADDISLLSRGWNSDSAERFIGKYTELVSDFDKISKQIAYEAEEINRISRHMYLIEKEAERLAKEDSQ